jgi:energy-coupling factor transporter ATP-binding protein EcfA2
MENFTNKISRLELENFTCFAKAEMDFSSGINVFIGENGTGKTHILKVLNSFAHHLPAEPRVFDEFPMSAGHGLAVMQLDSLSESFKNFAVKLLRKGAFDFKIGLVLGNKFKIDFNLPIKENGLSFTPRLTYSEPTMWWKKLSPLFIPPSEMLSFKKGFVESYEKRENNFDVTYYRLAKKLNVQPLKNKALEEAEILIKQLQKEVGIKIEDKNDQFYLKFEDGLEIQAPLAADGIKKLAQMIYLIQNGSLNKDTILFWDEPETNLNPKYIKIVAKFLQVLAKNGVQIFVATHDYLLTYLLSLSAEYPKKDTPPMRFFSLSKGENGTDIESANTIHGIQNNAILDEFADYQELMLGLQIEKLQNA